MMTPKLKAMNYKNLNAEIETRSVQLLAPMCVLPMNYKNLNAEIETGLTGQCRRPQHSSMNDKNLNAEIETGSQRLRIKMPTPLSIRRFSEPVLKSKKLSQSAVDLSIHSELQRRTEVGGPQPIGLGDQAPTIDLTQFANYRENMPLNRVGPSGFRKKPSFEEKTRFLCQSLYQNDFSNRFSSLRLKQT